MTLKLRCHITDKVVSNNNYIGSQFQKTRDALLMLSVNQLLVHQYSTPRCRHDSSKC